MASNISLADTTKSIEATVAGLSSTNDIKEEERIALLESCKKLKLALQTPFEATQEILFSPHQIAAVRIAIDTKLFDILAGSNDGLELGDLAELTGIEAALLVRLIRMLAGMSLLEELPGDRYKATELGLAFISNSPYAHATVFLGKVHEVLAKLPAYLRKSGYKNPEDAFDGPLQFTNGDKKHYFAWLESNPEEQEAFNFTMGIPRLSLGKEEWFDYFPVQEKLLSNITCDDVLLVDIGGGRGHDLIAFNAKFPEAPGKLIVQDLPVVIDSLETLPAGIEFAKHDFFTQQPIKGARAYYLRTVLHDWPDKQARKILEAVRGSMGEKSVLLLYELIVPDSGHTAWHASMDLTLMATLAALERTKQQWVDLLNSAGFELKAVWESKDKASASGSLLEAVPK